MGYLPYILAEVVRQLVESAHSSTVYIQFYSLCEVGNLSQVFSTLAHFKSENFAVGAFQQPSPPVCRCQQHFPCSPGHCHSSLREQSHPLPMIKNYCCKDGARIRRT
jgi:hypothetical protein